MVKITLETLTIFSSMLFLVSTIFSSSIFSRMSAGLFRWLFPAGQFEQLVFPHFLVLFLARVPQLSSVTISGRAILSACFPISLELVLAGSVFDEKWCFKLNYNLRQRLDDLFKRGCLSYIDI